jgi:hypothetical protein
MMRGLPVMSAVAGNTNIVMTAVKKANPLAMHFREQANDSPPSR